MEATRSASQAIAAQAITYGYKRPLVAPEYRPSKAIPYSLKKFLTNHHLWHEKLSTTRKVSAHFKVIVQGELCGILTTAADTSHLVKHQSLLGKARKTCLLVNEHESAILLSC